MPLENIGFTMDWDDELPEVPESAFSDSEKCEIDNDWLKDAQPGDQVTAMAHWFHARFWDPAHETPYMSSEGGYIWVNGGPYDATEEIQNRFSGIVSDEAIEEAIDMVQSTGIYDWAPTQLIYYDEEQDVDVDERNAPTRRLEDRLDRLRAVLTLGGDVEAKETAINLTYAGVISALETFLWETMAYWVENEDKTVVNLITKLPVFRDREIKLGEIYSMSDKLKAEVKAHLQNMVWHRWSQVAPLIKYGLDISPPSFRPFIEPMQKRHDIVHRSGNDIEGNKVVITAQDVRDLAATVQDFANILDETILNGQNPTPEPTS